MFYWEKLDIKKGFGSNMAEIDEYYSKISFYNADDHSHFDKFKLVEEMSPLTIDFMNIVNGILSESNIILTYPENMIRPITLISYLYSLTNNKSVLILTQNDKGLDNRSSKDIHGLNYHLLSFECSYSDKFSFYDFPMGIVDKVNIKSNIQLPVAKSSRKKEIIEIQKERFIRNDSSKILLFPSNTIKKIDTIDKIFFNKKDFVETNFDIGLVILENIDRFIFSEYSLNSFIKWIDTFMEKKVRFLFHFSNTESEYINPLKNKTKSRVIPFNSHFLQDNDSLIEKTNYYYSNLSHEKFDALKNINIDTKNMLNVSNNIEILNPPLESGNLDSYFYESNNIINKDIKYNKIKNKKLFNICKILLYTLPNLVINPSKYKIWYSGKKNRNLYHIPEILELYENNLEKENDLNKIFLRQFIGNIKAIYHELSKCKRYGEKHSFERIAKDYKLMEIGMNPEKYFTDPKNIIIASFSNSEHTILENQINTWKEKLNIEPDYQIELRSLSWLNRSSFDRSEYNLVLPGLLPPKYFSEILKPYKKILFLAYRGNNFDRVSDQVKIASELNYGKIQESYNFLHNICRTNPNIVLKSIDIDNFSPPQNINIQEEKEANIEEEESVKSFKDRIGDIIHSNYDEYASDLYNLKSTLNNDKNKNFESVKTEETITFCLKNISDGKEYQKSLTKSKSYLFLKNYGGKVEETIPENLKPGYLVVVLDNDDKKSLLELLISYLGIDDEINIDSIEYWNKKLVEFKNKNEFNYTDLYNEYKKHGGSRHKQSVIQWVKGGILGPQSADDLYIIGKMIGDENLKKHYELFFLEINKIRSLHIKTGKKISKIIKETILEGDGLDVSNLDNMEYVFYEATKNGIYEIVKSVDD